MITKTDAVLFVDPEKLTDDIETYLTNLGVKMKPYNDVWGYLRKREWGDGKVCSEFPFFFASSKCLNFPRSSLPPRHHTLFP